MDNSSFFDALLIYDKNDEQLVQKIVEELKPFNLDLWLYEEQSLGGDSAEATFRKGLSKSRSIVFFIGQNELREWNGLAFPVVRDLIAEYSIRLIPVLLPDVHNVPNTYRFLKVQKIILEDSKDSEGLARVYASVKAGNGEPDLQEGNSNPSEETPSLENIEHSKSNTGWESFLAFWTTLPGVITAVAALITALGGLYVNGALKAPDDASSNSQPGVLLKSIDEISASSESGASYKYSGDKAAVLEYEASGTWVAIPKTYKGEENVPKGHISANGYPNFTSERETPCPDANIGALVVKKPSGECVSSGEKGSFKAQPGDTFAFLMNDTPDMYTDNQETISVEIYKVGE